MKLSASYPLFVIITLFVVYSCKHPQKKLHNSRLVDFKSNFVYAADDYEKLDSNIQNKITDRELHHFIDTIKYLNGQIYISCLRSTVGCTELNGDIKIGKDFIKLNVNNLSDTVCSETVVWRTTYLISNKGNKHYTIVKD